MTVLKIIGTVLLYFTAGVLLILAATLAALLKPVRVA